MSAAGAVRARLDALGEQLRARHGWTHLEVIAKVDPEARRVWLSGEVAVARLLPRVLAVVADAVPGLEVDGREVRVMTGGTWHALVQPAKLLAACPTIDSRPRLATELRPRDGPLQRLGTSDGAVVVRGRDGTVGWLDRPLGPEVAAPVLSPPQSDDPTVLVDAARPWVGTPYRLGGVTEDAIDCSALVQRLAMQTLGVLVPRHSSDQLQVAPRPGEGRQPGDLSFVWSDREALCHVGIVTGTTVVHASLSRRRVVEDPIDTFGAESRKAMHVPFEELLAFGHRVAGAPSLTAAGFVLGRDADTGAGG